MGNFGSAIRQRIDVLRKKGADVPEIIKRAQKDATTLAVEKAVELTPPNNSGDSVAGTGTSTGELSAHWQSDSVAESQIAGNEYKTILANNLYYVSYVNDGHRMSKHFVPGLIINPYSGLLEKVSPEMGGIMVGTKTTYVKGAYMKQAAVNVYKDKVLEFLNKEIKELYKN